MTLTGLEYLKELITEKFDIKEPKKIIVFNNKLKFQHVLQCYYDKETKIFYGNTYHWWMNQSMRTPFWIPEDQINWLIKKLDRLENYINLKGEK